LKENFVNIAFNLPLDSVYTYSVPESLAAYAVPGARAVVNFSSRMLTGIIVSACGKPELEKLKEIKSIKDFEPILSKEIIDFSLWLSNYYIAPIGEVLFSFLPKSGFVKKPTEKKVTPKYQSTELDEIISKNKIKSPLQIRFLEMLSGTKNILLSKIVKDTGISYSSVNSLLKKDLIEIFEEDKKYSYKDIFTEEEKKLVLNEEQKYAIDEVCKSLEKNIFDSFLLYGVTGSGKTEVYIRIIKEVLNAGKQAIVLVPEISLTPQLIYRFRSIFGNSVGVIHSKLSDAEKSDTYEKILNDEYKIIIGARSALFSPFKNPGIIVVDEEHDSSYKQENSPRYNARDCAIMLAKYHNAVVLLGSATPSIESYYNADIGKYKLLKLTRRATEIQMPEIKIINTQKKSPIDYDIKSRDDLIELFRQARAKFLSRELVIALSERLEKKESVILLQNRRGYHSYIECIDCLSVEMCERCSISLTYHKSIELLKCHCCGFTKKKPKVCGSCGSLRIVEKGAGTEKIEEEIIKIFPEARIKRLDSDSVTSKNQLQKVLKSFYDGEIDILVGTQIISKGLDFPNVTLVGVVNADIGLLLPDFRSTEKTFQILTQVSGRSGRSEKAGEVLIQTNHPDYFVFEDVKNHDYINFYERELRIRKELNYPPFSRLALIEIKSKSKELAESKIKELHSFLKSSDKINLLEIMPVVQPLFSKMKDFERFHILIKLSKTRDISGQYLNHILRTARSFAQKTFPSKLKTTIDIDIQNLL
jgi:primosomal protein N' (replication factor Y)